MRGAWVYIMTEKPHGILYVGVTSDIVRRISEHRAGQQEGFTQKYGLKRLVYAEAHHDISAAIHREKRLKHWPRQWKINLIRSVNPDWNDLWETLI
jgi:putative endonuclease